MSSDVLTLWIKLEFVVRKRTHLGLLVVKAINKHIQ